LGKHRAELPLSLSGPAYLRKTSPQGTIMSDGHEESVAVLPNKTLADIEMEYILQVYAKNKHNKQTTAKELDISLKTLYNKLHKFKGTTMTPSPEPKDREIDVDALYETQLFAFMHGLHDLTEQGHAEYLSVLRLLAEQQMTRAAPTPCPGPTDFATG
jgi:hypothetical protein